MGRGKSSQPPIHAVDRPASETSPGLFRLAVLVAVVAGLVYLPSLWGDFVYDDIGQLTIDDYVYQPSHFIDVLTFRVMRQDVLDFNRPIMLLSLMIDASLWGHRPFGYHLTNVLLHVGCSLLVLLVLYDVLRRVARRDRRPTWPACGAAAGALLFAVHPINSEAVCPVTFREDLLAAGATFLTLWLAGRLREAQRPAVLWTLGAGCVLTTLLAVGAKESGAIVPLMLLAYGWTVRRDEPRGRWIALIAATAVVVLCFMAARFALETPHSKIFTIKPGYLGGSLSAMLQFQPRLWTFQLAELVWPGLLCADQTDYAVRNISLPLALLCLIVLAIAVVAAARKDRALGLGAAWYVIGLLPVSNLMPLYHPLADRYLYLPMLGVALIVGSLVARWCAAISPRARRAFAVAGFCALGLLACVSVQRALVWQHEFSLWQDTVARNPRSPTGQANLACDYYRHKKFTQSADHYQRALRWCPESAECWGGLAIALDALGQSDEAVDAVRKAIALDPRYAHPQELLRALTWEPANLEKLQRVVDRANRP